MEKKIAAKMLLRSVEIGSKTLPGRSKIAASLQNGSWRPVGGPWAPGASLGPLSCLPERPGASQKLTLAALEHPKSEK